VRDGGAFSVACARVGLRSRWEDGCRISDPKRWPAGVSIKRLRLEGSAVVRKESVGGDKEGQEKCRASWEKKRATQAVRSKSFTLR
jgi:hypothetical protein